MKNLTDKEISDYIAQLKLDKNYHGLLTDDEVIKRRSKTKLSKYIRQHKKRGFDETELWNLYRTIAKFIIPRLKEFKKTCRSYPPSLNKTEWNKKLDDYIWALSWDGEAEDFTKLRKLSEKQNEIMADFVKYFFHLWD